LETVRLCHFRLRHPRGTFPPQTHRRDDLERSPRLRRRHRNPWQLERSTRTSGASEAPAAPARITVAYAIRAYLANRQAANLAPASLRKYVKIQPNDKGNPVGKLADAELHFAAGLKLIGFGIWERRGGSGRNVTFPARQYSVNVNVPRSRFSAHRRHRSTGRIRELVLENPQPGRPSRALRFLDLPEQLCVWRLRCPRFCKYRQRSEKVGRLANETTTAFDIT
jgi:hypothetical protein